MTKQTLSNFTRALGLLGTGAARLHQLGAGWIRGEACGQTSVISHNASGKPSDTDAGGAVLYLHAA